MELSQRTAHEDVPNRLSEAVARAPQPLLDLTIGNPTTAGFPYPERMILSAMSAPESLVYEPHALGIPRTRALIAKNWLPGIRVGQHRIVLTTSTSESYSVLFKILCDPGDEILVPAPSYPLLGFLAEFESVTLCTYPLVYAGGWHVDLEALRAAITPRTKAIVVVSPNNPTGSYLGESELEAMLDTGLPIISDEVFASYPIGERIPEGRVQSATGVTRGLVFVLSGLSKLSALPQMKLGWIALAGERDLVRRALQRLELVLDSYLSVSTPVQLACNALLLSSCDTRPAILARIRANLAALRAVFEDSAATVLDVEGGWYAMVRVPETMSDEEWALALVEQVGVHVQPGYFFDMNRGAHLVVSLITPESVFRAGCQRMANFVREHA